MFAFCHRTDLDHSGAAGEEVTDDHDGSPERLVQLAFVVKVRI
jgi:hypothetical protein